MKDTTKFGISKKRVEDVECLYLKGYLDAHTAPILENTIQDSLNNGNFKIIVNFGELDYISSAGLGVFMVFIEDIRKNGGDIKLANMNEKVFSVFDLLGFPMLFDIHKEENHLISSFGSVKNI